jgi:hypothetical protein
VRANNFGNPVKALVTVLDALPQPDYPRYECKHSVLVIVQKQFRHSGVGVSHVQDELDSAIVARCCGCDSIWRGLLSRELTKPLKAVFRRVVETIDKAGIFVGINTDDSASAFL